MRTLISGGRVVDPASGIDAVADLWFENGRIIAPPSDGKTPAMRHDASGCIVMAGGIDIHSHIAGANVNTARLLLPELRESAAEAIPITEEIGRLYAAMGYTLVVEPAVAPHAALQAQIEIAEIPWIDSAILAVIGNEDYLIGLLRDRAGANAIADYAARVLAGSRALGLKVINPGGAAAFRANARHFGLDDEVPGTGVTSRAIILAAQRAAVALGVPHPIHLHCSNLGVPGSVETALATIEATAGAPIHLAHLQFYAYGKEGKRGFSSAAARLAEAIAANPHVTADVGQVMFGQTVTVSSDVLRQFGSRNAAFPRKWSITDGEGNGGGVVPYRYKRTNFYNAVQWAAGLELFLLSPDPSRVFFTTDHPNGAPFTAYPDLVALLMSADLRREWMTTLPPEALEVTTLPSITREYTWKEIAMMTRAAPARLLGLSDRGHLAPGAMADVAVYRPGAGIAAAYRNAAMVFRGGELIFADGVAKGRVATRALAIAPGYDRAIDGKLAAYYDSNYGVPHTVFDVPDWATGRADPAHADAFEMVPCRS
jgi:formylmethanofuran dehydrogenase subunit A